MFRDESIGVLAEHTLDLNDAMRRDDVELVPPLRGTNDGLHDRHKGDRDTDDEQDDWPAMPCIFDLQDDADGTSNTSVDKDAHHRPGARTDPHAGAPRTASPRRCPGCSSMYAIAYPPLSARYPSSIRCRTRGSADRARRRRESTARASRPPRSSASGGRRTCTIRESGSRASSRKALIVAVSIGLREYVELRGTPGRASPPRSTL